MSSRRARRAPVGWLLQRLVLVALAAAVAPASAERSADGHFTLTWESRIGPPPLNTIHGWMLTLRDAHGEPVSGARIEVTGGMPEHDHGLPTAPRVTKDLGDGRYLLEGMKFHMAGRWQLVFSVAAAGETDRVTVALEVQ